VIPLFSNPEFLRNVHTQLRPRKMAVVAAICGILSLSTAYGFLHATPSEIFSTEARNLLDLTLYAQTLILGAGGSIACLNNIFKEKERNSFDFQRITGLTSTELTIGKLFGAPALMYFVCGCLMPVSFVAATLAHARLSYYIAAYVVMVVASIAFHSLALLLSVLSIRGSQTGGIILILLVLWFTAYHGDSFVLGGPFRLEALGPFFAPHVTEQTEWSPAALETTTTYEKNWNLNPNQGMTDVFFGEHVNHVPVLLVIDSVFAFWFLLAVVRNIKRDPAEYELYSPLQFLGLAVFLNLLMVAFFNWHFPTDVGQPTFLLTFDAGIFILLGLALLRNRERTRVITHRRSQGPSWLDLCWPAPFLFAGAIMVAALIVLSTIWAGAARSVGLGFLVFRVFFAILWLVRDMQFLQWASLRKGKNALVMGVVYLAISYVCISTVFAALDLFTSESVSFTAFFLPTPLYWLDSHTWALRRAIWIAAFLFQCLIIGFLFHLQKQRVMELSGRDDQVTAASQVQPVV
jgi:hypothetical protein